MWNVKFYTHFPSERYFFVSHSLGAIKNNKNLSSDKILYKFLEDEEYYYKIESPHFHFVIEKIDDDEFISVRRMYSERFVRRDDERTDIEGRSLSVRDPVLIDGDDRFDRLKRVLGRDLRNAEAVAGGVHPLDVLHRAEKLNIAAGGTVRLHSLEKFLSVMENHRGRVESDGTVGDDPCVVPALFGGIIHNEHMVCEMFSETEFILRGVLFQDRGLLYSDIEHFE